MIARITQLRRSSRRAASARAVCSVAMLIAAAGLALFSQAALGDTRAIERTHVDKPIAITPRAVFLGRNVKIPVRTRILVVDLEVTNRSEGPIVLDLREAVATLNGVPTAVTRDLNEFRNAKFEYFGENYRLVRVEDADAYWTTSDDSAFPDDAASRRFPVRPIVESLPAGASCRLLLSFAGLVEDRARPNISLAWKGLSEPIDLALWSSERAAMSTFRLGPRGCIGVVSIDGPVDRVGTRVINEGIEELAQQQVRRVVFLFGENAALSEERIADWLRFSIANAKSARTQYSDMEMLTVGAPRHTIADPFEVVRNAKGGSRIDEATKEFLRPSLADAVAVAVRDVAGRFDRDDVLRELRSPTSPGITAAVLQIAGDKLSQFDESLVMKLSRSEEREVRLAAVETLAWFPTKTAVQRLDELTQVDDAEIRGQAIRSLLRSRAEVEASLLDRLADLAGDDADLLWIMSSQPRSAWRTAFDTAARSNDMDRQRAGVRGLAKLQDGTFDELMDDAFQSRDSRLRTLVVRHVLDADVAAWTEKATAHALSELKQGRADTALMDVVLAAREPSAVDDVLDCLQSLSDGPGIRAIQFVGMMATPEQEERLADLVSLMAEKQPNLARHAVQVLFSRKAPSRLDLARGLLENSDQGVRATAILSELGKDGTYQAEQLLIDQFIKGTDAQLWPYLRQQVIAIGGRRGLRAVELVLAEGPDEKARLAADARNRIWERSPAAVVERSAMTAQTDNDHEEAERLYARAIELDPDYIPALTNRGMLYLQWPGGPRLKDAEADYKKALDAAPEYLAARVGLSLCLATEGKGREAIELIEASPEWARGNGFIEEYNVACVYGIVHRQTLQQINEQSDPAERERLRSLAEDWKNVGLGALETSVRTGFRGDDNFRHMINDPDLESLRGEEMNEIIRVGGGFDSGDEPALAPQGRQRPAPAPANGAEEGPF